jgi:hypothetical protein
MKTTILSLVIVSLVSWHAAAQIGVREQFRFKDTVKIDKYTPAENGFSHLKIKMKPGEYDILNPQDIEFLKQQTVVGVDLVYSDYPEGADFTELNRMRLLELYQHLPEAFNSGIIDWNLVMQTGVAKTGGIQNYFHGFVVYYRPMPTFEEEKKIIQAVVDGKKPLDDSTLVKVFDRQKTWKDMLVVCDVTGSMSPYTAQILFWIKSNQKMKTFKQIVFFNDDEEKSTNQATKEDPTGMWTIETSKADKVIDVAIEAMNKGNHIENNLEAVCYAIKKYPENKKNIVMIADNWEDPCDMKLIEFLKSQGVVLHIVVCGVTDRLNTLYLDLAYATGGSVHTMEEDLTNIATIGEGKSFKLAGMKFKMTGGRFVQI